MRRPIRKYRWKSALLLAGALVAGCTPAEPPAPPVDLVAEEAAIRTRSQAIGAAEQAKDAAAVAVFYAEDAVVQPAGMPQVSGRAAFQAFFSALMSQLPPDASINSTTTTVTVAPSGDMAFETGVNQFTMGGVATAGKYLVVWRKINGEWMVQAVSWSDDTAPDPQG